MKYFIISLTLIGFTLGSCSEFLEEKNLSNVTAEEFYTTAKGYESLINANYSYLREIYGTKPWLFCAGTDLYARGSSQEPDGLSQYTILTSSSVGVDQLYNTCYRAIQTVNMALYYAEITEATNNLNARVGEIYYMRANAYFLLVQTYGGVGIVTDYINSPILTFDRNTAEEVYNLIISDLEKAKDLVSASAYAGRVNKRAVQNLLARVYLTRGYESFGNSTDFATAATLADEVIAGQPLNLSYNNLWKPGNQMNEEIIFSVQYDASSVSINPTGLGHYQAYYFGTYNGGYEISGDAPARSSSLLPTDFAISLFSEGDERWEGTFMVEKFSRYYDYYDKGNHSSLTVKDYYAPKWTTEQDSIDYIGSNILASDFRYHSYGTYAARLNQSSALSIRKFDVPSDPFGSKTCTRDIVLARLAETYLIAAEAYLHTNAQDGLDRLNVVRMRAGVQPATIAEFDIDYLLDERARELLGEYHRWFDLKRTGKLIERASLHNFLVEENNFAGANGELKILRPIPQAALDLNQNKEFLQNPAYR